MEAEASTPNFLERELVEIVNTAESDAWQAYVSMPGFRVEPLDAALVAVSKPAEVV